MQRGICQLCENFFIKKFKTQSLCDKCQNEYDIVKKYIFKNRQASIMDIYLETGVPIKSIKHFINEGKIEFMEEKSQ
ncbi:hypothetical protein [Thermohalobacter berrensis]|uniref:Flagellar protein n=1 Tax=Thermohalobacter berrensis TaxID=99594 RepID=A0A419T7M7_9FIRM|nr:hypothetical protein [Thermohalobacter berrensis]RKD33439.1 hypothetical protein BET03_09305 [Thermohalobacter berrensis]